MSGGKRPAAAKGRSNALKAAVVWAVVLGVAGLCLVGFVNGDSDDLTVPAPAGDERADTVPILQAAFANQGICYGWRLTDGYELVSVGSNLGDGTAAADAPGCPRWVELTADITYTSESSEANDSASIRVTGSDDIDLADLSAIESGLGRFGLDEDAFVDDPGWAATRAATTLPLLAAEAGLAAPAAAPSAGPSAAASPLPDAGSDFWRDRWGWLLATAGLFLLAALLVTVGVAQRRRQLRVRVPAQRAGAGAAGRTRETA
ncbi:hypothetical protein Q2K19_10375 [Micromonospora soli]|uniref:hypothetical protein n=1 Tax=Micromonospora sp. NBRC 110009 TaxID=3061627 RepID=UPI002673A678|nr:hypothetical protein [Micromonospora sp. NBRC 110009]WKU00844.1 hypothetical protein Q2K19_10375 [Micromonospora sp. NBRC 110009]